jgi:succinate dehydrogenase / fumarate reductase cytochrome b subunit
MQANNKRRPVYLDLLRIHLPVGGVVSIAHRITGVLMILALPWVVYLLQLSLDGEAGFGRAAAIMSQPFSKLLLLIVLACFALHFFAGVRHLLLDIDIGIDRAAARRSAWGVVAATVLAVVVTGVGLF